MAGEEVNLGLRLTATNDASEAVKILRQQLAALQTEIARYSGQGTYASANLVQQLQKEVGVINQKIAAVQSAAGATGAASSAETSAINSTTAAFAKQGDIIEQLARRAQAASAMVIRGQRAIMTGANEAVTGQFMNTAQILRAQRAVEDLKKAEVGLSEVRAGRMMSSAEIIRAQRATAGLDLGEADVGMMMRIQPRRYISLFDELSRGQRGAMVATMGASIKDLGLSSGAMMAPFAGLVALMGSAAILRGAENMGRWAQQAKAAASAVGMSLPAYTSLAGAFELMGMKGDQADYAMRQFAEHMGQALADPASKAAQAFHALGISQEDLKANANNTLGIFLQVANAWTHYADTATKAQGGTELFGRSLERITPLLNQGASGISQLQDKATSMGLALDKDAAQALIDVNLKIEDLAQSIHGEAIQAFVAWAPVIGTTVTGLEKLGDAIGTVTTKIGSMMSAMMNNKTVMATLLGTFLPGGYNTAIKLFGDDTSGLRPGHGLVGTYSPPPNIPAPGQHDTRPVVPSMSDNADKRAASAAHKEYEEELNAQNREIKQMLDYWNKITEAEERAAEVMGRVGMDNLRGFEQHMQVMVKLKQITPQQASGFDIQEVYRVFDEQKARLDQIMSSPVATQQQKEGAYWSEWDLGTQMKDQLAKLHDEVAEAAEKDAQAYMQPWERAFDEMGSQIESTIGQAIKSAFTPMKPEYWYSSLQGPHGQPLTQFHRINPTTQLLGNLGTSMLGDLGKSMMSNVETMLAKSIFGPGTSSISQGITSKIFGLFGMGPGAGGKDASQTQFQTSVSTFQSAVNSFASAAGKGTTVAATSTPSTTAAAAPPSAGQTSSFFSTQTTQIVGAVGAAGTLVASTVGGTAGQIIGEIISAGELIFMGLMLIFSKPSVLGTTFSQGGIVPSAAGGMVVGGASGGIPSILHPREMVLPSHLSEGMQNLINNGGGDTHLHLHSTVMDAPSIDRWFRNALARNASEIPRIARGRGFSRSDFGSQTP